MNDSARDASPDEDDPQRTTPLTRYNAMLAISRNTLFMSVVSLFVDVGIYLTYLVMGGSTRLHRLLENIHLTIS